MTQFEAKEITIGPDKYRITLLDPKTASDLLVDLMAIVGPTIAPLADLADVKAGKASSAAAEILGAPEDGKNDNGVERAAAAFFSRFDKKKQREILDTLVTVTKVVVEGKEAGLSEIFTLHFRGRLLAMYRWALAALRVQYADFFDSAGPGIAAVVQRLSLG